MRRFELLGGKYQQGEQILPGVIQSFRAYEVPTGRPVFIHRVPSKERVAQEVAGLLSAGLIHSASVRKMVLDVYESEPFRFIVTEPARQCVPLRDWLERESGASAEAVTTGQAAPPAEVPAEPEMPVEPARIEAARIERPRVEPVRRELALSEPALSEPAGSEPARSEPAETDEVEGLRESADVEANEFARMFRAALAGKMERARREAERDDAVMGYHATGQPALYAEIEEDEEDDEIEDEDLIDRPASAPPRVPASIGATTPLVRPKVEAPEPVQAVPLKAIPQAAQTSNVAPASPAEPQLFSQLGSAEKTGKSNLIIFLVVLSVLVVLLAMFVVVFAKR